ncbi:MAG: type II toxin-antitoxin system RelB/DinJ family antitoxin [Lachnospiraceae bacterium]|nr:type II toxin-antitoxin system RelB/DinJ family antitoxin [Lachnospiraceae bacterium]
MAQLSMRIDDGVKRRAEMACEALGLTMSSAINIYLVKLGNEMRIPFEVSADPFYNPENMAILEKSIKQLNTGKGKKHEPVEVD